MAKTVNAQQVVLHKSEENKTTMTRLRMTTPERRDERRDSYLISDTKGAGGGWFPQ